MKRHDIERNFNGSKVFLALRTDMFHGDVPNEHITLEYLGAFPKWDVLLDKAEAWKKRFYGLPVAVEVTGYATWKTRTGRFFNGALVSFPGRPDINFSKMWHITTDSQDSPFNFMDIQAVSEDEPTDLCDDIWIGYSDADNNKHWIRYDGLATMTVDNKEEVPF